MSKEVMVVGDSHGVARVLETRIADCKRLGIQNILHVGDYGQEYSRNFMNKVQTAAAAAGVTINHACGNHEDHRFLRSLPTRPDGGKQVSGNVIYRPRGNVLNLFGKKILFAGGAVSVNQEYLRRKKVLWQDEEAITYADVAACRKQGEVDLVIMHDAPTSVKLPSQVFHLEASKHVQELASDNRDYLQEIMESAKPSLAYHGHYHIRQQGTTTLIDGTEIPTIGLSEEYSKGSFDILDLESLPNK